MRSYWRGSALALIAAGSCLALGAPAQAGCIGLSGTADGFDKETAVSRAQLALADPEGRGRNVKHKVPARAHESFDGIERVQPFVPELLVVPGIFADGKRHAVAAEVKKLLALGRRKVSHFVEDVIGGQQHLRLQEGNFAIHEQRGGVHHGFARSGIRGSDQATYHGDAASFRGDAIDGFTIARNERRAFDEIARRIAANGELREQDQPCAMGLSATRVIDDFPGVAGKVSDRGVNLT